MHLWMEALFAAPLLLLFLPQTRDLFRQDRGRAPPPAQAAPQRRRRSDHYEEERG